MLEVITQTIIETVQYQTLEIDTIPMAAHEVLPIARQTTLKTIQFFSKKSQLRSILQEANHTSLKMKITFTKISSSVFMTNETTTGTI